MLRNEATDCRNKEMIVFSNDTYIMLIRITERTSDTTDDDSSNTDGYIKIIL
jgi:hypothetical protein